MIEVEFDAPEVDEYPLVYDAWVNSFRRSPWAGCVRNDMFDRVQRATIQGLLDRGARITVALAPRVSGVHEGRRVMGYAVTEPGTLHWLYVKGDYRRNGIGGALLAHVAADWTDPVYTHRTHACRYLPDDFQYDPVPARTKDAVAR